MGKSVLPKGVVFYPFVFFREIQRLREQLYAAGAGDRDDCLIALTSENKNAQPKLRTKNA